MGPRAVQLRVAGQSYKVVSSANEEELQRLAETVSAKIEELTPKGKIATSQSVLLVDDSAFFRNMLAPVLKAAGYKVRTASDAQEALATLRSGQAFDVVLTDIEMPEMNGFEFAEMMRADQHLSEVPVIGLSALVSPAAIERGRLAGFHDYVAKFDRPGLIAALCPSSRIGSTPWNDQKASSTP